MQLAPQRTARSGVPAQAGPRSGRRNTRANAVATGGKIDRKKVPLEMEDLELPINTYSPKKPYKAKIKTVKTITGPKVCCAAGSAPRVPRRQRCLPLSVSHAAMGAVRAASSCCLLTTCNCLAAVAARLVVQTCSVNAAGSTDSPTKHLRCRRQARPVTS